MASEVSHQYAIVPVHAHEQGAPVPAHSPDWLSLRSLSTSLGSHIEANPAFAIMIVFTVIALFVSILGLSLDPRLVEGQSPWLKPCKFSVSLFLFGASLIYMCSFLRTSNAKQWISLTAMLVLFGTVSEMSALFVQAILGASPYPHANSIVDSVVWLAVTVSILPVALAAVIFLVLLLSERDLPPVVGLSLRLSLGLAIFGMIPAAVLVMPQLWNALLAFFPPDTQLYFQFSAIAGIWDIAAKDKLRCAHFLGLHSLQVMPVIAYLLVRLPGSMSHGARGTIVWTAAIVLFDIMCLLICQALWC